MSATILKFPERRQTEVPAAAQQPASPVNKYDCDMMDAIRSKAEALLDVTRIPLNMLESFLHDGLELGSEFGFGQRKLRLKFQVEDLTPPKSFA
jgi:hypothetical protein